MEKPFSQSLKGEKTAPAATKFWRPKPRAEHADGQCPHCGGAVKASYAVCPHCGRSLNPEKCSFCGAAMKPTAKFCTSCGQPRDGVECPKCGTLNSRNFCRKCNTPLTPSALKAIEAAKADPAFKALQARADELAELHARIEQLRNAPQAPVELSEADKALLDGYAELLNSLGATPKPATPEAKKAEAAASRPQYEDTAADLDAIMAAYREKAEEMNAALAALTPPPDFTPEQQRDYYSARKVMRSETHYDLSGYQPSLWCCNFCGCLHNCPSECAEPQLGGTWIYQSPEDYIAANPDATYTTYKLEEK